ncbi:F-box/WD-40 repeat-containing protein At5g21040 [Silene latifolia]|uniref:F-box/WD-40 repeat-containing protein At5g21040 n=1 Tax=Silene latifolia TaxID=37657 RepID=UPI003D77B154
MAFECQDNSGKNNIVVCHNPVKNQLGHAQFCKKGLIFGETKSFGDINKVEKCEILVPKLEFSSVGHKLVATDEGSSSCRRSINDLPQALISEIFNCLDPKELGIVSCVSATLYKIASDHHVWKDFYCERWGLPIVRPLNPGLADEKSWKDLFVEREFRSRIFLGKYRVDYLNGHMEAVRTVFLLASAKLIFTAGYDSVMRIWDMEDGLAVASSRSLGCTIRAIAADTKLLLAGGTDGFIQCWTAVEGIPHLFDLKGCQSENTEFRLWEHEGPVTSLALDLTRIYSGSWDMTVRVWDRISLQCFMVLRHSDWVWSLAPHSATIASTSGSDVYIWDTVSGTLAAIIPRCHSGNTYALARSHTGDFLFTGGEDGAIHMFDISNFAEEEDVVKVATWIPHSGPVNSLAFEFPWLVSASNDGKLSLIDVRKLLKTKSQRYAKRPTIEPPQRMLHGSGSSLFSVYIGADRIVCGGEDRVVKVWDFSQALEREMRSRAQRAIRLENRMRQRRLQAEMSSKSGRADKCSVAPKKSPINGDRIGVWHNKRSVTAKVKA